MPDPGTAKQGDGINLSVEQEEEQLYYIDELPQGSDIEDELEVEGGGPSSALDLEDEELLRNPHVKSLFNKFWDQKMKEMTQTNGGKGGKLQCKNHNVIKSPSDTTIYVPALNKTVSNVPPVINSKPCNQGIEQIVNTFVDTVRLEHEMNAEDVRERERRRASTSRIDTSEQEARTKTDRAVIEAERFKATIALPQPGMSMQLESECVDVVQGQLIENQINGFNKSVDLQYGQAIQIPNIGAGVSDDDFFHLTCHIEPSLIHKIEKGEFIELEKLLPKDKFGKTEDRLEWVQCKGGTYLVPAQKDNKIASFRK